VKADSGLVGPPTLVPATTVITASDLSANPDGTWQYRDTVAPTIRPAMREGEELPGGPVFDSFWRRLHHSEGLKLAWWHNGGVTFLGIDESKCRRGWVSFKYELPPGKLIESGRAYCRFDYWGNNGKAPPGTYADLQVSSDQVEWLKAVRLPGEGEDWNTAPGPQGPKYHELPPVVKNWRTLYVRCLIDRRSEPIGGQIQLMRGDWAGNNLLYALELTLRNQ
jgi:hypothetical protein